MQKINFKTIRCAVDAMKESSYEQITEYAMPNHFPSPEVMYRKKEAYMALPKESKMIVDLIYHMPSEILEDLMNFPGTTVYYGKFFKFLRSHFEWKPREIKKHVSKLRGLI